MKKFTCILLAAVMHASNAYWTTVAATATIAGP